MVRSHRVLVTMGLLRRIKTRWRNGGDFKVGRGCSWLLTICVDLAAFWFLASVESMTVKAQCLRSVLLPKIA
jgi:hypothetical protein